MSKDVPSIRELLSHPKMEGLLPPQKLKGISNYFSKAGAEAKDPFLHQNPFGRRCMGGRLFPDGVSHIGPGS